MHPKRPANHTAPTNQPNPRSHCVDLRSCFSSWKAVRTKPGDFLESEFPPFDMNRIVLETYRLCEHYFIVESANTSDGRYRRNKYICCDATSADIVLRLFLGAASFTAPRKNMWRRILVTLPSAFAGFGSLRLLHDGVQNTHKLNCA